MTQPARSGRLSTLAAAFIIARRDFTAILFSRSFFFFLLGPLFPILVGGLAGGIGQKVQDSTDRPELGIAMSARDVAAMKAAHQRLSPQLGASLPVLVVVQELKPGEPFDAAQAMKADRANLAAIVTGSSNSGRPVIADRPQARSSTPAANSPTVSSVHEKHLTPTVGSSR